jgi:hypothetical protein
LTSIIKLPKPCSARQNRDYGESFDSNQKERLKARTGKREAGGTELDYWRWVYDILFPIFQDSSLPITPCKQASRVRMTISNTGAFISSLRRAELGQEVLR